MEDRGFLIKLFSILAVVLIVIFTYVILDIQFKEAHQPEQYLGSFGDSQIKSAPNTASSMTGARSSGAQSQREERLALEAEKKRQEVTDCVAPAGAVELPLSCTTLESDIALVRHSKKRQEEVAKKCSGWRASLNWMSRTT